MATAQPCPLEYPLKFKAAVLYVTKIMPETDLPEESKLLLYALQQQGTVGPCNEPRPWGWNVVSNAKWQSWKQLGDMTQIEAMRLYVRTLEEEIPNWWSPEVGKALEEEEANANNDAAATQGQNGGPIGGEERADSVHSAVNAVPAVKSRSVAEVVVEGSWVSPYIASDRRPPPRYEQAVALVGNNIYVIGGNCGGRYLADTWALNLENLSWRCVASGKTTKQPSIAENAANAEETASLIAPSLSPIAGHAAVPWNGNVVVIGGHSKAKEVSEIPLWIMDTQSATWSPLSASLADGIAAPPRPRGSHSATIIGSKVYVFGGEDTKRKLLDDLWVLDLSTMTWDQPEVAGRAPSGRAAHSACSYRDRYILFFGGGSVANCFDDLAVLDTQTMEWSSPESDGPIPPPRAGHAAAILGSILYVVGGGNNTRGCADMYALDLADIGGSAPLEWTLVGNTPAESAIAAEGLSLLTVPMAGCMVSFGGYNGRYHNAVHVYRPEGFVIVKPGAAGAPRSSPAPAAPAGAGAHHHHAGSQSSVGRRDANEPAAASAPSGSASQSDLDAARREAAAAKEAVALEISIMRRQLDSATTALADAERAAEEAREALAAEQQKAMSLEVEVAELRQKLVAMGELERELARYRQRAAEDAAKKPGLWGFITGADQAVANTQQPESD